MADFTVKSSLEISKSNLKYQSKPPSFTGSLTGASGPTPGLVRAAADGNGAEVSLALLTTPGLFQIANLSTVANNFVELGIWDPETGKFYPVMEVRAGETFIGRISRRIREEYGTGASTGTSGARTNQLRLRANVSACDVMMNIFEA